MSKLLLLFFFAVCFHSTSGQFLTKSCVGSYAKSYLSDSKKYVLAPLHWNKKQVIRNTSILAVGGGLFFADKWIGANFPSANSIQREGVQYGLENFGNGLYSMPLMAGMFIYGISAKKELPFSTSLMGVKSFVLSTLVTRALKYSLNRSRPNDGVGPNFWGGPFNPFSLSFPSGHTTGAFAVASVLAKQYKHVKWIPVVSYTLATGVGISRLWTQQHWSSDVFFGALVGWSVGTIVTNVDCSKSKEKSAFWQINPMGISYSF